MRSGVPLAIAFAGALAGCVRDAPPLGTTDVSVLLPLPASLADGNALALATDGNGGALLPEALFDRIPPFATAAAPERAYAQWRVVAARLDPCFPDLAALDTDPASCTAQLRLVAQPLVEQPGGVVALDDAIHLLYQLDAGEFAALASAWTALGTPRTHDRATPFGVHPEIAAQGTGGPIATALRALVVRYAGAATLAKLTYSAGGDDTTWQFGGLHRDGGAFVTSVIPNIGTSDPSGGTMQTVTVAADGTFAIAPQPDQIAPLVALASQQAIVASPRDTLTRAVQLTLDLDNPRVVHVDKSDCASCHVATRARVRALDLASPDGDDEHAFDAPGFALALALPDGVASSPRQLRGLGYKAGDPVWDQRVVNDSAAVATAIAEHVLP